MFAKLSPDFYTGSIKDLFVNETPLIDVRAPVEFQENHFPGSINLPLLDNNERHQVGSCYKEKGQAAAIELGVQLVSGPNKNEKIARWLTQLKARPDSVLYCARGGLRSQISQHWIKEAGGNVSIIEGGHKRIRQEFLTSLTDEIERHNFLILSGNTGSGKTRFLEELQGRVSLIDLEKLANHRGSAFGKNLSEQPTQATFENALLVEFWKVHKKFPLTQAILLEDESATIGRVGLPRRLFERLRSAPIIVLKVSAQERAKLILQDYVIAYWPHFETLQEPFEAFLNYFKNPLDRIQKRLGGARYKECLTLLERAIEVQKSQGSFDAHLDWIQQILVEYYDPLYEKGLSSRGHLVQLVGTKEELQSLYF